jgi:hypothetical protein
MEKKAIGFVFTSMLCLLEGMATVYVHPGALGSTSA